MCNSLYAVLQQLSLGNTASALLATIVNSVDNRQSYQNPNTVILIPAYKNCKNAIVIIANLGVPLKPADYVFDSNTGTITINNYQIAANDAVYLIPTN